MLKQSNANTFKSIEETFKGAGPLWSVDPAIRNFSISNAELKLNLRVDFGTNERMFQLLPSVLNLLIKNGDVIHGERQLSKRNNPNTKYEYFMRGWLASKHTTYIPVAAHAKKGIAYAAWLYNYDKCRSKKSFINAIKGCPKLSDHVHNWKCMHLDMSKRQYILVTFESIFHQKKFDDFLDTLILLEYNKV